MLFGSVSGLPTTPFEGSTFATCDLVSVPFDVSTCFERSSTTASVLGSWLAQAAASRAVAMMRAAFFIAISFFVSSYKIVRRARASIRGQGPPGGVLDVAGGRREPLAHASVAGNRGELPAPADLRLVKNDFTVGGERRGIVERPLREDRGLVRAELEHGNPEAS